MHGSKRMGIETVAKNNGEKDNKEITVEGRGIDVWHTGLSEHTKKKNLALLVTCCSL